MEPIDTKSSKLTSGGALGEVVRCLENGGSVVTANARSARILRHRYDGEQLGAGHAAWQTPAIYDWEVWQSMLWKQFLETAPDPPLLLSGLQERSVWRRIAGLPAGAADSIALLASSAWRLLSSFAAHEEARRNRPPGSTVDTEKFRRWAAAFQREGQRNRRVSRSDLLSLLAGAVEAAAIPVPSQLLLVGFDRIVPSTRAMLNSLSKMGCSVRLPQSAALPTSVKLVAATDLADELLTCAWWARRKLEEHPSAEIAIIVQDIGGLREEIERTFRRVLLPQSMAIESNEEVPFEFSLGRPLAAVPLVNAALLLLRWLISPLEQAAVSWLLVSGFLSAPGEDLDAAAWFDAELRESARLSPEISLDALLRVRLRALPPTVARLLERLRELLRWAASEHITERSRTVPEWLDFAGMSLARAQWPGARALESVEFQALDRWQRLIAEIGGLGFDGSRVDYREFVAMIERYAEETIFAPESRNAPIQIMGPLESSGQEFDALWFLDADEQRWPETAPPHPLLPLPLQAVLALPHSSFEVDWQSAMAITRRVAGSAAECVFSYIDRDSSGEIRASPVLDEVFGDALTRERSDRFRASLHAPAETPHECLTVRFEDTSAVAWPRQLLAGGADILKNQSACDFRAFALRRLGAIKLEDPVRGLSPRDRGSILHKVLEALWSDTSEAPMRLQTRHDLLNAKATGRLPEIVSHHISEVFHQQSRPEHTGAWSRRYLELEQTRLRVLLLQWLDFEAERHDFTVEEREKGFKTEINGLQLSLRVDRIDRVEGGRLIMDYKASVLSASNWEGERPEEPQLPLYAVHGQVCDLRGVLFALVKVNEVSFVGRAHDAARTISDRLSNATHLVQKQLDEEMIGEWREALDRLSDQFLRGDAAVAPKSYPKTCRYCGLQPLCRVAESTSVKEADDEPIEDENGNPAQGADGLND